VDRDAVIAAVRAVLQGRAVRLAVLFGSAARGAMRDDSDVDVGILPVDASMSLETELALQASLERALGRCVDLVRLDRADILTRWRVAREGAPVLAELPAGLDALDRYAEAVARFVPPLVP
jgi:predicted nucleotidyltransferase